MRKPRAYSLVEMVLVISALALLLGLCVSIIHGLVTLDRAGRARLNEGATLDRLAHRFRLDVHAAVSGRPLGEHGSSDRLELKAPDDRTVEYRWNAGRLLRFERRGGRDERHDAYRLASFLGARFQVREEDGHPWAALLLEPKTSPERLDPPREVRLEALVGKDRRLAGPRSTSR